MYQHGSQRIQRFEEFTNARYAQLGPATVREFLRALMGAADLDGNVDLDMVEFDRMVTLQIEPIPVEQYTVWVNLLIEAGFLNAYEVEGQYFASIDGWANPASPRFQGSLSKSHPKSAKWRNPTPEMGTRVAFLPEIGDASARAVVPRVHRNGHQGHDTAGSDRASRDRDGQAPRLPHSGLRREGKSAGQRVLRLKRPSEAPKDLDPIPTTQKARKKLPRRSRRATEAFAEDPLDVLNRKMALLGRTSGPKPSTGGSVAQRIGDDWMYYPGDGRQGLAWLLKHGIRERELPDAEDYIQRKQHERFGN